MKRCISLSLLIVAFCASICAQTPNDLRSAFERRRDSLRNLHDSSRKELLARYEHRRDSMVAAYNHFRDSCNKAYAKHLADPWGKTQGKEPLEAPKGERLPDDVLHRALHPEERNDDDMMMTTQAVQTETTALSFRDVVTKVRDFFSRPQNSKPPKPLVPKRSRSWTRRNAAENKPEANAKPSDDEMRAELKRMEHPTVEYVPTDPTPEERDVRRLKFTFYGTPMEVGIGTLAERLSLQKVTEETVSEAWTLCSDSCYKGLVQDCLSLRDEYQLDDWGYLRLLHTIADAAFASDDNARQFLTAYIFSQSGYQVRLIVAEGQLRPMYGTHHTIFGKSRIGSTTAGRDLYSLTASDDFRMYRNVRTCDAALSQHEQPLSLAIPRTPMLGGQKSPKRIIQSDQYPEMRIEVAVDTNLVAYMNDYLRSQLGDDVMTQWAMYAETPLAPDVQEQIYPTLRKALEGKSEEEQLCRLLSLVQPRGSVPGDAHPDVTSLVYAYDNYLWHVEDRIFFPEETLFYPYSDCEDHAILFARLVRDLLGMKVMLVYYPGLHLATAVHMAEPPQYGPYTSYLVDGEIYYVCDPTYQGARPGMAMPDLRDVQVHVIPLNESKKES